METLYTYQTADPFLYRLLKNYVKELRLQRPTEAESVLWNVLRGKNLGCKFRRQHIIGPYIADFCCIEEKLVVEIDGGYHQLPQQQVDDLQREEWLGQLGFSVVRFSNEDVIFDIDRVIEIIKSKINHGK